MTNNGKPPGPIDFKVFLANSRSFPREQLAAYVGKQIAWSADGTRIVAAADTDAALDELLRQQGVSISEVVFSYVDDPSIARI